MLECFHVDMPFIVISSLYSYVSPRFSPPLSCIRFGFTVAFELALNIHKNIKKVFYASSSRQLGPKNFLTSNRYMEQKFENFRYLEKAKIVGAS